MGLSLDTLKFRKKGTYFLHHKVGGRYGIANIERRKKISFVTLFGFGGGSDDAEWTNDYHRLNVVALSPILAYFALDSS